MKTIRALLLFFALFSFARSQSSPVQLLKPSTDHNLLLVNEAGIEYLSSIKEPGLQTFLIVIVLVSILAVVGPYHSGSLFSLQ